MPLLRFRQDVLITALNLLIQPHVVELDGLEMGRPAPSRAWDAIDIYLAAYHKTVVGG